MPMPTSMCVSMQLRVVGALAAQAMRYRDEVDVLQEASGRAGRLQAELAALRDRLPALERDRAQLQVSMVAGH